MTAPHPTVRLLVCGTADRGDDGAALAAVARLLPALPEDLRSTIEIHRCGQLDPLDLVAPNGACGAVSVVLDTVLGVEPGSVVRMPLSVLGASAAGGDGALAPRSTHALAPDAVVRLAEAITDQPVEGTFIGIGGRWFGFGRRFSRAVTAGLPAFEAAILFELERLRDRAPGAVAD